MASAFDRQRHIKYFAHHLVQLPYPYSSLDTNRLTLVHFAVHALDMLQVWDDDALVAKLGLNKTKIIDWIYNLQVTAPSQAGFQGGTFLGNAFGEDVVGEGGEYNKGHIAMTYTALCTLTMLGDDLSRVHSGKIISALKTLQTSDGSFKCVPGIGSEQDTRFLFCACAISHMLKDWSGVDQDLAVEFIKDCRSFDGAIALIPGQVSCVLFWLFYIDRQTMVCGQLSAPFCVFEEIKIANITFDGRAIIILYSSKI